MWDCRPKSSRWIWRRWNQGVSWIGHYSWIVAWIVRFWTYSILFRMVLRLFYSILFWSAVGNYSGVARIDAWGQCRSVESQSGAQIWSAFYTNRQPTASKKTCQQPFPQLWSKESTIDISGPILTPSKPLRTPVSRVGPSLRRSKNYSNYSWIVLNSGGLNYLE